MAMPSSGCIALRVCISGIACSSISCAVAGIACSPASLCGLSVEAGKTAPHAMSEFYGYTSTTLSINPTNVVFNYIGGLCTITVTTSAGNSWSTSTIQDWITIINGNGNGNGNFCVCVLGYEGRGDVRYGSVCVTSSAPTQTLNIEHNNLAT